MQRIAFTVHIPFAEKGPRLQQCRSNTVEKLDHGMQGTECARLILS